MRREFGCVWRLTLRMQGAGAGDTRSRIAHFLCPVSRLYRFLTESQARFFHLANHKVNMFWERFAPDKQAFLNI